jgi:Pyridoxamine 5'-phosphate oxidase
LFDRIEPEHRTFIERQRLFFVATAAPGARVNLSPKGLDGIRVLGENRVAYLDLTGSGNETAAHLLADGRLTIMFCAFEGPPMILRLYGRGRVAPRGGDEYAEVLRSNFDRQEPPGARQLVVMEVEHVQTSCGYGVPRFEYVGERPSLINWAESKGEDGLAEYRTEKNTVSIDGLPTGPLRNSADPA